jgi:amidase
MNDLATQSLSSLAALIRSREVSPVEVLEAHLHRIADLNPTLNAIVTLAADAMEKARDAEAALMRGDTTGALHGVPVTIKDTIQTKNLRTTSGSRVRAEFIPDQDAPAVARLRKAGAIILGKTNVAEMAAAYDTENPVFDHANNPYDLNRTTGGSSGGEAAAIAACLSLGGLGSDLMGSIRVPAHFCGIVGLRPTTGRVESAGHIPTTSGVMSHGAVLGPMARCVADVRLLFRVLAGSDEIDQASQDSSAVLSTVDLRGCNVAWHDYDGVCPVTEDTRNAVESVGRAFEDAGCNVRDERPPGIEQGHNLWSALFARAAAAQLRDEYAGREDEAGSLVRYILDSSGNNRSSALDQFSTAWEERNKLRTVLLEWLRETPLIVSPVGAMPAFEHGARHVVVSGESISIFRAFSYSQTYTVFDLPSVCVPAGPSRDGLPIGIQIVGKPNAEEQVLAAAEIVERAVGGWRMPSCAISNS